MSVTRTSDTCNAENLKSIFDGRRVFYVGSIRNRHSPKLFGGQQVTYQHIEVLRSDGVEAFAVTNESNINGLRATLQPGKHPEFMHIKQFQREINPDRDVVVLPGRYADRLDEFPGTHKVLFSQGIWVTLNAITHDYQHLSPFQHPTLRGIMVVSEGNAEIARLLRPACPVVVVRNSVSMPSEPNFSDRHQLILHPSLSRYEKNPWDTLAVKQVLKARYTSGRCPKFIEIEGIPHTQLLKLMREASTLLFLSTHEGLPLLPLEAMANGTLALGYNRSPMSELFHERCLFRFGDIESIVDSLESIIKDPADWLDVRKANFNAMLQWSRSAQTESIREAWQTILQDVTNPHLDTQISYINKRKV